VACNCTPKLASRITLLPLSLEVYLRRQSAYGERKPPYLDRNAHSGQYGKWSVHKPRSLIFWPASNSNKRLYWTLKVV
jgi:hypothetical protein